ncbi:MAG: cytochrome c, partial [Betaproteobacteria bacterium]|nr:cytochrome c [Betaproteobacteria bacterium]
DAQRGRELYEAYCGGCHYERVHQRGPERTDMRTLEALRAEVMRWAGQTRQRFTREDIEDIVAYLNRSHYHLGR